MATIECEYNPVYCSQLEAAYGAGMMSEGGAAGIDHMFQEIPLQNKKALDIGSGLGGVAFYLADKHSMCVTGLEVTPWLVEESKKRIPWHLKDRVDFVFNATNNLLPFDDASFDIVYSKGVLTHVEKKEKLFAECHRIQKPQGLFVITDWLSSEERRWGEHISKLIELENLSIFPESESHYSELLTHSGFKILSVCDESVAYIGYNQEIIDSLHKSKPTETFNEADIAASISGYESIVKALKAGELRVLRFVAEKS